MRMLLGLPDALPTLVGAKFRSAKASSSLIFSHTELATIRTSEGIPFQLRYCPALAKKPEPKKETDHGPTPKPDPFENPPSDLLIAETPSENPTHVLVLNKFPVIAEHFIIATKSNKEQTHALEKDDLQRTYACLKAWHGGEARGTPKRLFAFFNSGDHSGASQPHRHLQFLPVECMVQGSDSNAWQLLIDLILASEESVKEDSTSGLLHHPAIPFMHFACRLPSDPTGDQLLNTYNTLYQRARKAVDDFIASYPDKLALHNTDTGSLPISYNLAMTTEGMAILPRRAEGTMLRRDDGSEVGFVALNGTVLGGTLMVKYQEEWDLLRKEPKQLDAILEAIGIPKARL